MFNQFIYHGKQVIVPEKLVELDTTEIAVPYGTDKVSVPEQRYRDVVKLLMAMTDGSAAYCILAAENEAKVHYAVPVKNSLREMYADCSEEILRYAMDYRVNLITPSGLSDSEIDEFQSNMREIMRYIKYSKDKKALNR